MNPAELRIASLVPSITELLVALGLQHRLVARTGFCVHPRDAVQNIPKVGGTKDVDLDRLRRLAPTHVVVNVDENRAETAAALRGFVPHVLVTHPCAPQDNLALFEQMAQAFAAEPGVAGRAAALAAPLRAELGAVGSRPWPPRRVLYLIWRGPWMTVARDTYISRLLALVNWHTWPDCDGGPSGAARYPVVDAGEAGQQPLQEVLLSSEPYRFGPQHVAEAQALCPGARVRLVDGELLSWYGPRATQGLRYLQQLAAAPPPDIPQ
jgi:ABC-type Fe3+-hydroxamate transport system substrate-binding protein